MQRVAYRLSIWDIYWFNSNGSSDGVEGDSNLRARRTTSRAPLPWSANLQQRLRTMYVRRRAGELTIAEFLMAVWHNVRLTDSVSTEVPTPATEPTSQPAPALRRRGDRANLPTPATVHPHTICCVICRCCRSDIRDIIHIRFGVLFFTYLSMFILYLSGIHD